MTINKIHELTIKKYGANSMLNKAIQEMNELIEELRDNKAGVKNVHCIMEEIADCRNMIDKLLIIFDINNNEVCEIQKNKMIRTYERLNS